MVKLSVQKGASLAHDIGGVSEDHEIHLGNWHHGKVATHGGYQKKHSRKYFQVIFVFIL